MDTNEDPAEIRKDLDETRRLLYMALCAPFTKRYNLAGTLVNALLHHQSVDMETDEVIDRVLGVINGDLDTDPPGVIIQTQHREWAYGQIARISDKLND